MHLRSVGLAVLLAAPLALASLARADHKDDRIGFTIATPKNWTGIPMGVDEHWMIAKYMSDKTYFWTEKGGGWTWDYKPDMQMIAFVEDAVKEKYKLTKKEERDGRKEWIVAFLSPYKNYKDFMTRRYSGGGWFIDKEKQDKVGDVPVTCYEIRVEKNAMTGPKHIITWIYHVPDVDLAVQFEVLEDSYPKLQNEISRCLKSFKPIARSGAPLFQETATAGARLNILEQDKLSPEERKALRIGQEKTAHEKVAKTAPDGWTVKQMGHFLVMNHADEKYAKKVVEQAEAVWKWLDETFPTIGKGEYVRSPILRICADRAEATAFFRGESYFSINDLEITTCQDYGGATSWEMERVNRGVKRIWFLDRDRDLALAMPGWLGWGLDDVIGQLRVKNGKVDFRTDYWNKDEVRERVREGKSTPPRQLMMMFGQDFWNDWMKSIESAQLVSYFLDGAAGGKKMKDLLPEYMKNLRDVVAEVKKENAGKEDAEEKKPQTEEEEDAYFKDQKQGFKQKEQRLLEDTFKRTFRAWAENDWKDFEQAYFKAIG